MAKDQPKDKDSKSKAVEAAKAARAGGARKRAHKVRTTPSFRR